MISPWLGLLALGLAAEPPTRDAPAVAMPDRHWDVVHLDLDVRLDLEAGTVEGRTEHLVRPLGVRHGSLRLHQAALDIREVAVDGAVVEGWRVGRSTLDIPMPAEGAEHLVAIRYGATPQVGLHFRGAKGTVDPVREVWSQGEDVDNRHWFPSWDHPSDKFTLTTAITVPDGLVALGNGVQQGKEPAEPGWTRWTYSLDRPIVNYLVALAAGDYRVVREEGPVPLEYVGASTFDDAAIRRGFDQARPQMVYLSELLDEPFPYPVYRQVMVSRFMYGGMENSTLTIMADTLLQPDPRGRTRRTEEVTAHELAHQWFGDQITCYGWRELWLNEGFATFYTGRWMEHSRGGDYYATKVRGWLEAASHLTSPMAPRGWSVVDGRDNEGVYVRGASVLHMLRVHLGDEVFDEGIRLYVDRNADRLVETDDLRRAMEDVSGTHLGWFFDQWVHGVGVPELGSSWSWVDGELAITLSQTTEGPAFWAPVEIEIGGDAPQTRKVWLGEGEARLVLPLEAAPDWVAVDPRGGVLAKWTHEQEPAAWAAQAVRSPSPYARIVALEQLGEAPADEAAVGALVQTLADDELEPAIREVAAQSLGALSTEPAVTALLAGLRADDAYLREAVVWALGEGEDAHGVVPALVQIANGDPDPGVRGAAVEAVAGVLPERGLTLARRLILQPDRSWQMQVHRGALTVLGEHGKRSDYPTLLARVGERWPRRLRQTAAWGATQLLSNEDEDWAEDASKRLERDLIRALEDPDIRVRQLAVALLGQVGGNAGEDALQRFAADNEVPGLSEEALDAAASIRTGQVDADAEPPDEADIERLQQTLDELQERLERLEQWR